MTELSAFWQAVIRGDPPPKEQIRREPAPGEMREAIARAANFLARRQALMLAARRRWWAKRNNLVRAL